MKVNDDAVEESLAWGITPHDLPCYGKTDLFFAGNEENEKVSEAKRLCREECPLLVRVACYDGALRRNEQIGVWGGFSAKELRQRRARSKYRGKPSTLRVSPKGAAHSKHVIGALG